MQAEQQKVKQAVRILLIEDDEDDFILTQDALQQLDFIDVDIDWADSPQQAIERFEAQAYDLCLLDYQLGAITGINLLQAFSGSDNATPVIMLTGQYQEEIVKAALEAGATDYLLKSEVSSSRFARSIRYALARNEIQIERLERLRVESENRAKDQFLAHLSHELRTPLTSIIGYTELLLSNDKGQAAEQELNTILRNGKHLLTLLNDVLDLSKVKANKLELEIKTCDLQQLVNEVISLTQTLAKEKNLLLNVLSLGRLPEYIETDPKRLRQVLINLIGNAIKFTHQGHITLTLSLQQHPSGHALHFAVTDTGLGIQAQDLSRVFSPFEQVDDIVSKSQQGTGLGLSISQQLVNAMGGEIQVESTPNKGSCFSFSIDIGKVNTEALIEVDFTLPLASYRPPTNTLMQGKILVVDDMQDIRHLVSEQLTAYGLTVNTAENGQKAIHQVNAAAQAGQPFNIILLDLHMPVLDGYQTVAALKKCNFDGKVIALTAAAQKEIQQKLTEAGFDLTLPKPIQIEILINHIKHLLKPPSKPKRILLVEDDEDAAQATQLMLENLGAQVAVANNASQCLQLVHKHNTWHKVVLDINLPDMNGLQLAEQLREMLPALDIVMLSGEQPEQSQLAKHNLRLLLKPLFMDDLKTLLN